MCCIASSRLKLECRWEQSAKDLGRYVQVGRIDIEKERRLAKKFNIMTVPMIYTYIDGNIQTFYGTQPQALQRRDPSPATP